MKTSQRIVLTALAVAYSSSFESVYAATTDATGGRERGNEQYLSLIGHAHVQYHPTFSNDVKQLVKQIGVRKNKKADRRSRRRLSKKDNRNDNTDDITDDITDDPRIVDTTDNDCNPAEVNLLDYPQWEAERGYWIGDYTFLKGDGTAYVSDSWNYPYDHYKGFITGEVVGNSYRQRNVFVYPPQIASKCVAGAEGNKVGDGECGTNGNTKVFQADQSATTCSSNEALRGNIEGPYVQGAYELPTKTELVGRENGLVYQVFIPGAMVGKEEDVIMQSQLTTITEDPTSGQIYRTRTAQSFDAFAFVGKTTSASYYREKKVTKEEFYESLNATIVEYNIRSQDLCAWDSGGNSINNATGSFDACEEHLEESFLLE